MRILVAIHHELDPNAGASGATVRLADALRRLGHEVDIISFDDMTGRASTRRYRFPWFVMRQIATRARYDVYDVTSGDGWAASRLRVARPRHGRSIIVARSHGLEHILHEELVAEAKATGTPLSWKYPIYNGGFRLWECRQSFASADLSLFLNERDQDYAIERFKVARPRTARVINGVGSGFIAHARMLGGRPEPAQPAPANVAFIGTYIERKGIRFLRDAMVEIMQRHREVRLGYFGTGRSGEDILATYPQDLRSRVAVTPRYDNTELLHLLEPYHILAFPSLSEGFPLAPAEAMACGLVPVVNNIPGATDIVTHERNGLVMAEASEAELRRGIGRLLDDKALWRRLRRSALADVENYSWDSVAARHVALYEEALDR